MTIEKGGPWGEAEVVPADLVWAADDADLAQRAAASRDRGEELAATVGPGDVLATLGLTRARAGDDRLRHRFDLALALLDDEPARPFVAHLVARRRRWAGTFAVVMNTAWWGQWYLGPRAHPNDGLLDVTVGSLAPGQRILARRRVVTGTHLPHPGLQTVRCAQWAHHFDRPIPVSLDGVDQGRYHRIEVRVVPDCFWLFA